MATSIFILLVRRLARWSRREISLLPRPGKVLGSGQEKKKKYNKNISPPANGKENQAGIWVTSLLRRAKKRRFWGCRNPVGHRALCRSLKHTKPPPEINEKRMICAGKISVLLYRLSGNSTNSRK